MVASKKESHWAQYQSLLVRRPVAMNITQGGIITAAGSVVAQLVTESTIKAQPLIEQVLLTVCFIAPIVSMWIPFLGGLRLHWAKATAVDQFLFSPLFNVAIFFVIAATFKGGVALTSGAPDAAAGLSVPLAIHTHETVLWLSLWPGRFPTVMAYDPIWSTLAKAYRLWLPAVAVREVFVPAHLKGPYSNLVSFVWNIVFAIILASGRG